MTGKGLKNIVRKLPWLALCAVLWSCVPSGEEGGRKNKKSTPVATSVGSGPAASKPAFSEQLNFFQNGQTSSTNGFILDITFGDSFYLRGFEVHNYIATGNSDVACLVFNFPDVQGVGKTLIFAGNPRSFFNFSSNTKENYLFIEPANKALNQTFCQGPGTLNFVGIKYPTSTIHFALGEVCTNCSTFLLDSSPLELVTKSGQVIGNVKTSHLDLKVKTQGTLVTNPGGVGCVSTSECLSKGFDCCSGGQCVKDLTLKSGVDPNSPEFLQAMNDIALVPSHIQNYPNFFHICAHTVVPTPTPAVTEDPFNAAAQRFTMLKELFECTSLVKGEMSLCTKTYKEVRGIL